MGVVDQVISERGYFAAELMEQVKAELIRELNQLSQLPLEDLLEQRYQRFRKY